MVDFAYRETKAGGLFGKIDFQGRIYCIVYVKNTY